MTRLQHGWGVSDEKGSDGLGRTEHGADAGRMITRSKLNACAEARNAFRDLRGLDFTVEWHCFEWTHGADLDCALVAPAYLGSMRIGLKDGSCWIYRSRDGRSVRTVPREQLADLVNDVCDEFAGYHSPLPRRSLRRGT